MLNSSLRHLASHKYFDRHFSIPAVKVLPGEYYFTSKDVMLSTVLGSCVAACIHDRVAGIGGMNHFLLPENGADADGPVSESMRYGAFAMEVLINALLKTGAHRANLVAKVFGGGNMLPGARDSKVGARNANFVLQYLKTDRIPILSEDLEDQFPRRVCFFPRTGRVMVKKLRDFKEAHLLRQEMGYQNSLSLPRAADDMDLF